MYEAYSKDDTDFSVLLSKVADANVDVLFLPDYYNKVSLIGKQANEKGITAAMMGGDGWDSPELDLVGTGRRLLLQPLLACGSSPRGAKLHQEYTEKYGAAPDALAVLAYDAANILMQSIQDAKNRGSRRW